MVSLSASPPDVMQVTRRSIRIDSSSTRYDLPKNRRFAPQYAHIYFCRLIELRSVLAKSAHATYGPPSSTLRYPHRIVDISSLSKPDEEPVEAVVFGVVFREIATKPSILGMYKQDTGNDLVPSAPERTTNPYADADQKVHLEDENGRCTLDVSKFSPIPDEFVTGFIVAVRGVEDRTSGLFYVKSYATVQPAPQKSISPLSEDRYVCIASGLSLNPMSMASELLAEFLKGNMVSTDEEAELSANIVQFIIAGDLVPPATAPPVLDADDHKEDEESKRANAIRAASDIADADRYLSGIVSSLPTYYMPGANDPANFLLPQQRLHRCLLPSSSRNENLHRVTNPFECESEGRLLLATSGQNVTDFSLYSTPAEKEANQKEVPTQKDMSIGANGERALEIMEVMLNSRHIAPTCPDTLGSYPFFKKDPFILENTPHAYIVGNQADYASKVMNLPLGNTQSSDDRMEDVGSEEIRGVRLISVPRFDQTNQVVLLNLRTMECSVRCFNVSF